MAWPRAAPPPAPAAAARIDLLRLLLVGQVLCGHFAMIAYPPFRALDLSRPADLFVAAYRLVTRFGTEAAYAFVAISGFLLVPRLLAIARGEGVAAAFLRGRLRRIYPTLVAALALTLLCDLAARAVPGAEPLYRTLPAYDAWAALGWQSAAGNLLSLQPTAAGAFGSNGPLWTLGYIVQFYAVGAALAGLARWRPWAAGLLLLALFAAAATLRPQWGLLLACWLGCGAMPWWPARSAGRARVLGAAGLALFIAANLAPPGLREAGTGAAAALWLAAVQAPPRAGAAPGLPRFAARAARASYPLYAFHYPLALLLFALLAPQVPTGTLAFRLVWPLAAAAPALALALAWQAALDRAGAGARR